MFVWALALTCTALLHEEIKDPRFHWAEDYEL